MLLHLAMGSRMLSCLGSLGQLSAHAAQSVTVYGAFLQPGETMEGVASTFGAVCFMVVALVLPLHSQESKKL